MNKSLCNISANTETAFKAQSGVFTKNPIRFTLFIFVMLLMNLINNTIMAQTQLGNDIDGEGNFSEFGYAVSLSSDGQTLAIGARAQGDELNGMVQVYKLINGNWTQQGDNIEGESDFDQSGTSVSLSSDGLTVAIGALTLNAGNKGQVRVYKFINGTWTKQGTNIDGENGNDNLGYSVSLSSDGLTLAAGAPGNAEGHVKVYKFINDVWTQQGSNIYGEADGDNSGHSVSLSSDGLTLAIGAIANNAGGHVRVYKLIDDVWIQQGNDMDAEGADDQSGHSVSLSSDGLTLAIGAPMNLGGGSNRGHVRVYKLIGNTWTQQGSDIDGETNYELSGYSVSLSSDGLTVAIGAPLISGGHVKVYKLIGNTWTQQGDNMVAEADGDNSGYSVSLSSDGLIVAMGAWNNAGAGFQSGHARVYRLGTPLNIASYSQSNIGCGSISGSASVTASGGTLPYAYSWSPSGGSSATASGLAIGSYSVTVTDAFSASATQTFTIAPITTFTYTGTSPDDWLDEGNWSPCYPGTTIPAGYTFVVSNGSNLIIPSGTTITNNGSLINDGTLNISGGIFRNYGIYGGTGIFTGAIFTNPISGVIAPGD